MNSNILLVGNRYSIPPPKKKHTCIYVSILIPSILSLFYEQEGN